MNFLQEEPKQDQQEWHLHIFRQTMSSDSNLMFIVVVVFLVWFIRVFSFSSSFIGVVVISAVVTVVSTPFFDYHCRSRCHLRRLCLALDVLTRTMATAILWMSFIYHTCKYVVCSRARFPCRLCSRMERNNNVIFDCKTWDTQARKIWHDLLLCHIHWFKVNALISVNKKFSIQKATLADWVYFIAAMGDIDGNNIARFHAIKSRIQMHAGDNYHMISSNILL